MFNFFKNKSQGTCSNSGNPIVVSKTFDKNQIIEIFLCAFSIEPRGAKISDEQFYMKVTCFICDKSQSFFENQDRSGFNAWHLHVCRSSIITEKKYSLHKSSGERFRKEILAPALEQNITVKLNLKKNIVGCLSYNWLVGAFGKLVNDGFDFDKLVKNLQIVSCDQNDEIWEIITKSWAMQKARHANEFV